jgi:pimeloyl-ACP methyl ester carboxylesterase
MAPSTKQVTVENLEQHVRHGYAENDGVNIHYASLGSGPLVVMIHGFPDFWYSWRYQMIALAPHYQVVALDLRGYNLSDKPDAREQYAMPYLIGDVLAVIQALGKQSAIVVGHDWGGTVAWNVAIHYPEVTEKLVILNLPHMHNLMRELAHNPEQRRSSQYARDFQLEGTHLKITPETLTRWVRDDAARTRYREAFERSSIEGMLNFYKMNYPHEPYKEDSSPVVKVKAPVLQFHGLQDEVLLPGGLNDTWQLVEQSYTLVTEPNAGHFIQHDAPELVSRTLLNWLAQERREFRGEIARFAEIIS